MKTLAKNASLKTVAEEAVLRATRSLRKHRSLEHALRTAEDWRAKNELRRPSLDAFVQLTADAELAHHICRHAGIELPEELADFLPRS